MEEAEKAVPDRGPDACRSKGRFVMGLEAENLTEIPSQGGLSRTDDS